MFRDYTEQIQLQGGHSGMVTAIAFSPRATYLATSAIDRKTCIWETSSRKLLYEYVGSSYALCLAWIHKGGEEKLLCGMKDGYIVTMSFSIVSYRYWRHSRPQILI